MRGGAAKFENPDGDLFSLVGILVVGKDGVGKNGVGKNGVGKDKKGGGRVTSPFVDGMGVFIRSTSEVGKVSESLALAIVGAVSILAVGKFPLGFIIRIPTAFTPGTWLIFSTGGWIGRPSSAKSERALYPAKAVAAIAKTRSLRFARR